MISVNTDKRENILAKFKELIGQVSTGLAPWQQPREVENIFLFPSKNNSKALEFLFLLGALNFSYWQLARQKVTTWGVSSRGGTQLRDVFALAYCLAEARQSDLLELSAETYSQLEVEQVRRIFADRISGNCSIPLLRQRVKKINELGQGLQKFAEDHNCGPSFLEFCRCQEELAEFNNSLEKYFPYSFGDPFRKLSQLLFKMIVDRRDENMPPENQFSEADDYDRVTNFSGVEELKAQPDYMLPLFCLKTGLWDVSEQIEMFFTEPVELPMSHPVEHEIRENTVEIVAEFATELPGNTGLNSGRVDSIMWQTAVQGCFPGDCENCSFQSVCAAQNEDERRLNWHHHLTRTPYY